jgi:type IV pilus assembly protein PilO
MAMELNVEIEEALEKLAKVPKPARFGAIAGIIGLVIAGYYFMQYKEVRVEIAQQRAQAEELQRKLNKVRVVASNLEEFEQEVADLERELQQALKQLPNRKQFEDLLQDITTAGKKVGVGIRSIERRKEVVHDFYAEVPFKIELEGSYHDIARFFERVSRLPRIVNMGAMDMKVESETEDGTVIQVDGVATTFRFLNKG